MITTAILANQITTARAHGYLFIRGGHRLREAWYRACLTEGRPFLVLRLGQVNATITMDLEPARLTLTPDGESALQDALRAAFAGGGRGLTAAYGRSSATLRGLPYGRAERLVRELVAVVRNPVNVTRAGSRPMRGDA